MPWQPADPGSIAQDAQGAFHIKSGGAWIPAPKGSVAKDPQGTYHFNSDAVNSPSPPTDATGAANAAAETEENTSGGPIQHVLDMLKAAPAGAAQMLESLGKNAVEHPILGNLPALADTIRRVAAAGPSATISSVGSALQNATPEQVGRNVVGPLAVGGAAGEGAAAVSGARAAAAAEAAADPAAQLGLRTAQGPAVHLAGDTAGPTLAAQNQRVASSVLGADVGVPHSSPVNPATLETARAAPGKVLDAGYGQVPTRAFEPGCAPTGSCGARPGDNHETDSKCRKSDQ